MSDSDPKDPKPAAGPRYYRAEANPDGAAIPGVPLADFTAREFKALPLWVQRSIDAAPFYSTEAPPDPTAPPVAGAPPAASTAPGGLTPVPAGSSAATMPGPQAGPAPTAAPAAPAPTDPAKES